MPQDCDVLVQWKDGTRNVVRSSELSGVKLNTIYKEGARVKMLYKTKWYYGKVLAVEEPDDNISSDDDDDNIVLSELRSSILKNKMNTDSNSGQTRVTRPLDSDTSSDDDVTLYELSNRLRIRYPTIVNSSQEIVQNKNLDDSDIFQIKNVLYVTFLQTDDDDDDDDDLDGPLTGETCQINKCRRMGIDFCDCGFWLCIIHFAGKNVRCTLHEVNGSDSDTAIIVKKGKITAKMLSTKTKEEQKNSYGRKDIVIQHLPCEFLNCNEEIFAREMKSASSNVAMQMFSYQRGLKVSGVLLIPEQTLRNNNMDGSKPYLGWEQILCRVPGNREMKSASSNVAMQMFSYQRGLKVSGVLLIPEQTLRNNNMDEGLPCIVSKTIETNTNDGY
nr:unnamed protein product [Callosobruchus chinensis]